jgi:nucleoside-diphosphate-sugar epimerase
MTAPILRARRALYKTSLKVTQIANGAFMDYFGQPNIPSRLRPNQWAVDVPSRRAAIPGTGNEIISLTYSKDFARFVARLIDDDDWPKFSNISGSETCLDEIVAIAEKVTGTSLNLEELEWLIVTQHR